MERRKKGKLSNPIFGIAIDCLELVWYVIGGMVRLVAWLIGRIAN